MSSPSLSHLLGVSLLVRVGLVIYGEVHDRSSLLKYTDVDYRVFSDAARHLTQGASPYLRHTYRYTPLLALILQPNILLPCFGKLLFSVADICIGYLTYKILSADSHQHTICLTGAALWLLNPIAAGVSTRGNAESLLGCLVLCTLLAVKKGRPVVAGVFLALSVHLKMYPIIYSLPMFLHLAYCTTGVRSFVNSRTIRFVLSFGLVQTALVVPLWYVYGYEFLYETYLYHLVRSDTRHNFSPYFYLLYLSKYAKGTALLASFLKFVSFLPQALLSAFFALRYFDKIELCLTLQTISFVMLNKVSTSQYFLWYLWLIPLLYPRALLTLLPLWLLGQAAWLFTGYLLEFQCLNYFLAMHFSGLFFLLSQCFIVCNLIRSNGR